MIGDPKARIYMTEFNRELMENLDHVVRVCEGERHTQRHRDSHTHTQIFPFVLAKPFSSILFPKEQLKYLLFSNKEEDH